MLPNMDSLIAQCRICGSGELESVLNLGKLPISGYFPYSDEKVPELPLDFSLCLVCGLHQLRHLLPIETLYSSSYGYESHLNASMVNHLRQKAKSLYELYLKPNKSNKLLDIASNDGTFLKEFSELDSTLELYGCDPLISNFTDFYPIDAVKIYEFFGLDKLSKSIIGKLDLVTSLSVFYDLDKPIDFAQDVWHCLKPGGIWHLEQSYCLSMFQQNSFDTICHEHILYLNLSDFLAIFEKIGFEVLNVDLNKVNGGSIALTLRKCDKNKIRHVTKFLQLLEKERQELASFKSKSQGFEISVQKLLEELDKLVNREIQMGRQIFALGASTKGNIILGAAKLDYRTITAIGDINPKKFGRFTPGTLIPIVPEEDVLRENPMETTLLILPWHFRDTFVNKTIEFRELGGRVIFPLPYPTILTR